MKKTQLKKVSKKQMKELARRGKLKKELIEEFGPICMTCNNRNLDWRGLSLSHIIPLSRGGKTEKENLILLCGRCHSLTHNIKEV